MKIRDAVFLVIGGLLVISGMVLNELIDTNAFAQENQESKVVEFDEIKCNRLVVGDGDKRCILTPSQMLLKSINCERLMVSNNKGTTFINGGDIFSKIVSSEYLVITNEDDKENVQTIGAFGSDTEGRPMLVMYGDDGKSPVAYLGENKVTDEMMLQFKSRTDKRQVMMGIDERGGRFDAVNKLGELVGTLGVGIDGGGIVDLRDKHGYKK